MYVKRNGAGEVVAVSDEPLEGFEAADADDPSLAEFIWSRASAAGENRFRQSDSSLIRVIEDLVDLLATKGIICFTDLPPEAQEKLMARKSMRGQDHHLNLVDDVGDDLFDFD